MKKSKLAVGLMSALLSVGALAGCDNTVRYSKDGLILTYVDKNGDVEIKTNKHAQDLFEEYYADSSKYQSIFDQINSIVVRNYFNHDFKVTEYQGEAVDYHLGVKQMAQIELDAQFDVDSDKRTAQDNADNNDTKYKDEFESILSSKGVKNEKELKQKYIEEHQQETFNDNFYKFYMKDIKNGATDVMKVEGGSDPYWTGYFKDMVPYHVSHILVKLEDGSGTNYSNGTISEDNAKKLFNVVNALKTGKDAFSTTAELFSEDGSSKDGGDLGIMDYSTGYVNEFKLGVYAYENLISANKAEASSSNISIPNKKDFQEVIAESFDLPTDAEGNLLDVPTIPFSVFEELKEYSEETKDEHDKSVIEDATIVYPRNIIYNKYLNRHSIAFITNPVETGAGIDTDVIGNTGFHKYLDTENSILAMKDPILSVKTVGGWTPVLTVRAGSDYQGIHFIIVNRSPFEGGDTKTVAGVSLDEYYTVYNPDQKGYPKYNVGTAEEPVMVGKKTYVNFSSTVPSVAKNRAESLASTFRSFDSDKLNKYIFKKYFAAEKIKIKDEKLASTLNTWLNTTLEKKEEENLNSWNQTWKGYVDTLSTQNSERTKLVSEACKIGYTNANKKETISVATKIEETNSVFQQMRDFLLAEGKSEREILILLGNGTVVIEGALKTQLELAQAEEDTEAAAEGRTSEALASVTLKTYSELFKTEGGLCNDGKTHI